MTKGEGREQLLLNEAAQGHKELLGNDHNHTKRTASIVRSLQSLMVFFALLTNLEKADLFAVL